MGGLGVAREGYPQSLFCISKKVGLYVGDLIDGEIRYIQFITQSYYIVLC